MQIWERKFQLGLIAKKPNLKAQLFRLCLLGLESKDYSHSMNFLPPRGKFPKKASKAACWVSQDYLHRSPGGSKLR